jgi:hypothetical protein
MKRALLFALTMAAAANAASARADDQGAQHDAQARFEEGLQRAKSGDFAAARISFMEAYAVLRRPRILWNLALSEEKTGHTLDALAHFKAVAHDASAEDADRAGAQTHVAALYGVTGHIEVSAPAGAPISIDGGPIIGTAPLSEVIDVPPGRHVVEARLAQGSSAVVVSPAAGEVAPATFVAPSAVVPIVPPAPPAPVAIGSTSPPPSAAAPSRSLAPGNSNGNATARAVVVASAGGVAVAAAVLGIYFGVASKNDADSAQTLRAKVGPSGCNPPTSATRADCSQLSDDVNGQNRDAGLSTAMYVTAGALAAAAVVTWFVWPLGQEPAQGGIRLAPAIGPGLAGISGSVSF